MQRLHLFWRKSNCPNKFKIIALDAVVKSKLIYGIDSLQLNEPELKKLEKNHLQAMRKILKWDTTYINRDNTNKRIYQEINKLLTEENHKENNNKKSKHKKRVKEVQTFAEAYKKMRVNK